MVLCALLALGALLTSIPEVAADADDDGRCHSSRHGCINVQPSKPEVISSTKEETVPVTRR